jgi:hypothetical protein
MVMEADCYNNVYKCFEHKKRYKQQRNNALVMEALQQCHASTMEEGHGTYNNNVMLATKML